MLRGHWNPGGLAPTVPWTPRHPQVPVADIPKLESLPLKAIVHKVFLPHLPLPSHLCFRSRRSSNRGLSASKDSGSPRWITRYGSSARRHTRLCFFPPLLPFFFFFLCFFSSPGSLSSATSSPPSLGFFGLLSFLFFFSAFFSRLCSSSSCLLFSLSSLRSSSLIFLFNGEGEVARPLSERWLVSSRLSGAFSASSALSSSSDSSSYVYSSLSCAGRAAAFAADFAANPEGARALALAAGSEAAASTGSAPLSLGARPMPAPKDRNARTSRVTARVRPLETVLRPAGPDHLLASSLPSTSQAPQPSHQLSPATRSDWWHLLHFPLIWWHFEPKNGQTVSFIRQANSRNDSQGRFQACQGLP